MTYEKLPGHRRGFIFGSSVWLGPDHLLLVKSYRFREEYRRFYFRDIQAIVVANAPRFHISTRSFWIGYAWTVLFAVAVVREALWFLLAPIGLALIAACIYVSAACSCRCRIYTAVSSEELRSLYRRWNARRFVEIVEPRIIEAQGLLAPDAAEALDQQDIGPLPEGRVGLDREPGAAAPPAGPAAQPVRTTAAMLLVASLAIGGAANLAALGASAALARPVLVAFAVLQIAAAVAVIVENYRGRAASSLRNLAIVTAVAIGAWYYAVQIGSIVAIGYRNAEAAKKGRAPTAEPLGMQLSPLDYPLARGSAAGMGLIGGLAGAVLLLRGERAPEEKVSFDV